MANPLLVNAAELLRRPGNEKRIEVAVPLADLEIDDPDRFDEGAEVAVRLHLAHLLQCH